MPTSSLCPRVVSRASICLASALLVVAGAVTVRADRSALEVRLEAGQKAVGEISFDGERDAIEMRLLEGEQLKVLVKRGKKSPLVPHAGLIDDAGDDVPLGGGALVENAKKSLLKKVPVPATGTYLITVAGDAAGPTGTYALKSKVKAAPKLPTSEDSIDGANDTDEVEFDARPGTRLDVVLKAAKKSDLIPRVEAVFDPDGFEVPLDTVGIVRKQADNKDILKKVILPKFGTYRLRIGGQGSSQGGYKLKVKLKGAKPEKVVPDFTGLTGGEALRGELLSIDVGTETIALADGEELALRALGTYADESQADLSRRVNWATLDSRVAGIGNAADDCGVLRPVAAGATQVFAFHDGVVSGRRLVLTGGATVASVAVQPSSDVSVRVGEPLPLLAVATLTGADAGFETADVSAVSTWSAGGGDPLSFEDGAVVGTAVGAGQVTAELGGSTSPPVDVAVLGRRVVALTVSPPYVEFDSGTSGAFSVTATFADGTLGDVTEDVTLVSDNLGSVTVGGTAAAPRAVYVADGTAGLRATLDGVSSLPAVVNAGRIRLTGLAIEDAPETALAVGDTTQLRAVATFDDGGTRDATAAVTWVSSRPASLSVENSPARAGLVSGLVEDTELTVGATLGAGGAFVAATPVDVDVAGERFVELELGPTIAALRPGHSFLLTARARGASGAELDASADAVWSSSDTSVTTVTDGVVTAVSTGGAVLSVEAGGLRDELVLLVDAGVTGVTLDPLPDVVVGTTGRATARVSFTAGATAPVGAAATWFDTAPATVRLTPRGPTADGPVGAGALRGLGAGDASLEARVGAVRSGASVLSVGDVVRDELQIFPQSPRADSGTTKQLAAQLAGSDGSVIDDAAGTTWASLNQGAATVDEDGLVELVGANSAVITADNDGRTDQVTFSILGGPPALTSSSPGGILRGQSGLLLTIRGERLDGPDATVTFSGSGLTADTDPTVDLNGTRATVRISAAGGSLTGARDLTYTTASGSATLVDAVIVTAAAPTLTSISPTNIAIPGSGSTQTTLTLTGENLLAGDTFTLESATGVSLSNVTVVNTTTMTGTVTVSSSASAVRLDVTLQQAVANGGATDTLANALKIGPPDPTITGASPSFFLPGQPATDFTLTGTNFLSGITVEFPGVPSGATLSNVQRTSATTITGRITLTANATIGAFDVRLTNPADVASTFDDVLAVAPRDPTLLSVSAASLVRGVSGRELTLRGTGFRDGAVVSASASGVTFSGVDVVSHEELTVDVTVAANATLGASDLTVSHAASEGGRGSTLSDAIEVVDGAPSVTSVEPSELGRTGSGGPTRRVRLLVDGSNFSDGATVTLMRSGGSGLTVVSNSVEVLSDEQLAVEVDLAGTTTTGDWDVLVTNPASAGDSGSSGDAALAVNSESTLTVNRVLAGSGASFGGDRVTIHGAGFQRGCQVEFGTEKALLVQFIDQNTLVCEVPEPEQPASSTTFPVSQDEDTFVDVQVTNSPGGSATSATLTDGYAYEQDDTVLQILESFPADGATGVSNRLKSAVLRLNAPAHEQTVVQGGTRGTQSQWFESGSFAVSSQSVGFGADPRFLVFSRSTGGTLTTNTQNRTFILEIATATSSLSGGALLPTQVGRNQTFDQWSFSLGTTGDSTGPSLSSTTPGSSATGVSTIAPVTITFNEELDPLTVTTSNLKLEAGGSTVPTQVRLSDDLKTVTLKPFVELARNTVHTIRATASVADLSGNTISAFTRTFTTNNGTDTTAPTIDAVVVERLPSTVDGSGTYTTGTDTPSSGGSSTAAFDLYLPRHGWEVVVRFSDDGGGIDASTFSAKASVASGQTSANTDLSSKFTVTSTEARWRIASADELGTGDDVTLTFDVDDVAGNSATSEVITFDVVDRDTNTVGSPGRTGDHDPFDARRTWVLRDDVDVYTASFSTNGTTQQLTTTGSSNGIPDVEEALRINGLWSPSMTTASQNTVNGNTVGTNLIVKRLFMERMRGKLRERFGIDEDGGRGDDAPDIEFLLRGEQGSLSAMPTLSNTSTSNSGNAYSEMDIGGDTAPNSTPTGVFGTVGRAFYDDRNEREEVNLNSGSPSNEGIFVINMFKFSANLSTTNSIWGSRVLAKFQAAKGGTPVGESSLDSVVLAGTFDRTAPGNTQAQNDRYDDIMDAIELSALSVSGTTAHEIGHSLGLVPDGAPKTGLFGNARRENAFTDSTAGSENTTHHLDFVGPDVMSPSSSVTERISTGSDFARFNPMIRNYLLGRQVHDEGK